jgi:hypothetical protein
MVGVSRTSILRRVKGIEISPQYRSDWEIKRGGSRERRLHREEVALKHATELLTNKLSHREKLLILSCLYWAEGSKKDFGLSNTDPQLISVFLALIRDVFQIDDIRLRISIRIYEDLDRNACLSFWSEVTKVPEEQFVSVNVLQGKKIGKLQYGMCRVRVAKAGDLLKELLAINRVLRQMVL